MKILHFAIKHRIAGAFFLAASTVQAVASQTGIDSGDTAWILSATALVLFMTLPGLALFYAGLVQSKNIVSVLMHHFSIAALMSLLWVCVGYSLAFSGDGEWFGDLAKAFMVGVNLGSESGTIPESLFAAFQMTFAIITPALIIGAYVERMKFAALLIFSGLWLLVVYAPVTHWVWGDDGKCHLKCGNKDSGMVPLSEPKFTPTINALARSPNHSPSPEKASE